MKPWQALLNKALLNKAPSKGGKEEKERDPKWVQRDKATNYFPKPPPSQEAYRKRKKNLTKRISI
jgi:hypothetical protein